MKPLDAAANEGRNVLPDATDDQAAIIEAWAVAHQWPYRDAGDPLPTFCPKCGRTLLPHAWGDSAAYLELACAGRLQWFFARRPFPRDSMFIWNHYRFTVDKGTWNEFDALTSERTRSPFRFGSHR